jgi:hypothetical protein
MHYKPNPSNKSFGFFFSFVFLLLGAHYLHSSNNKLLTLIFFLGAFFLFFYTLFFSSSLACLNKAWMALGHLLGNIVSPVILGFIFFLILTPVALIGSIARRDPLRLKMRSDTSYWIKREPPGPAPDSFKNQF